MGTSGWTFLTNHAHVVICLTRNPEMLLRDVAAQVGITERAVQKIVGDLEQARVITRSRVGRRNRYAVRHDAGLRHPVEGGATLGDLLDLVAIGSGDLLGDDRWMSVDDASEAPAS